METLLTVNLLLSALYGAFLLLTSRTFGRRRATAWFGAANLSQAGAMFVFLVVSRNGGTSVSAGGAVAGLLLLGSALALHRSCAHLLEQPRRLWRWQVGLAAAGTVGLLTLPFVHSAFPSSLLLISALLGIQTALTASTLFCFSGDGLQAAGWFAGVVLSALAVVDLTGSALVLRSGTPIFGGALADMEELWLFSSVFANASMALAFLFLTAGRLRLELLWRAQIDELTGLLNRWAFKRIAVRETLRCLRMRGRLAVVMIDLDGMKGINDRFGHPCGDAVLQAFSATVQDAVRDRDSVARMGGDEFCILLPDTELSEAMVVAQRLCDRVEAMVVRYRGEPIKVRASFGVSCTERAGWNWQDLVEQSDAALYQAKRSREEKVVAAPATINYEALAELAEGELESTVGERRRRF